MIHARRDNTDSQVQRIWSAFYRLVSWFSDCSAATRLVGGTTLGRRRFGSPCEDFVLLVQFWCSTPRRPKGITG